MSGSNLSFGAQRILFTVVVPVYNAQETLPRALESVLSQCRDDTEIVVIDDGSSDGSALVCDSYGRSHHAVRVVHSDNLGVSSARNKGIGASSGEWLLFLDADDYFLPGALDVFRAVVSEDFDVVASPIVKGLPDGTSVSEQGEEFEGGQLELARLLLHARGPYQGFLHGKLVRASIVRDGGICFDERFSYGEDEEWLLRVAMAVKRVKVISRNLYHYSYSDNSLRASPQLGSARGEIVELVGRCWPDLVWLAETKHTVWQNICIKKALLGRCSSGMSRVLVPGYRKAFYLSREFSAWSKVKSFVWGGVGRILSLLDRAVVPGV